METVLSGYCRTIDGSRMVLIEDGEADCDFETCRKRRDMYEYLSVRRIQQYA